MMRKATDVICRTSLILSGVSVLSTIGFWFAGYADGCGISVVACPILLAAGLGSIPSLRGFRFTVCIIAAVAAGMVYPQYFRQVGSLSLTHNTLMLVVIQLVMFGMGTQMSLHDFAGVVRMPRAVIVGIAAQFTIMPLVGFALANGLPLPPEIGAGIILIGSCSSGLASNVMNYLAGANLALSVTLTAVIQSVAFVMTPLWMQVLAGKMLEGEFDFLKMMVNILLMVVLPICVAFIYNGLRKDRLKRLHRIMPVLSMAGIVYFTLVTTAAGREHLLKVGVLLFVAAAVHNMAGYVIGYWFARLCRLDEDSCRTIAIEVGLQNGGMATGLASGMGKLATVGLAATVFSPWMNISGSILANYWRRHRSGRTTLEAAPQGV